MRLKTGQLNSYDFLQAAITFSGTDCGRRKQLEEFCGQIFYRNPYSLDGLIESKRALEGSFKGTARLDSMGAVIARRIGSEVDIAVAFLADNNWALELISKFRPTEEVLDGYCNSAKDFYAERGIEITPPSIRIVETLPSPFGRSGGSVLAVDSEDEKRFGIPAGLYFTPRAVTPIFAECTVAHELIHWHMGQATPEIMCTLLEEGLAEYLAAFEYLDSTYSASVAINYMKLHRLTSAIGLKWDNYIDSARAVHYGASQVGRKELYNVVGAGRDSLSHFEETVIHGAARDSVPSVADSPRFSANYALNIFPRYRIISALAYEVALHTLDGDTQLEIAEKSEISPELVANALLELESDGYVILRPDRLVVEFSGLSRYLQFAELRYDFR